MRFNQKVCFYKSFNADLKKYLRGLRSLYFLFSFLSAKLEDETDQSPLENIHELEKGAESLKSHVPNDAKPKDTCNIVSSKAVKDTVPPENSDKENQSGNTAAICETPFKLVPDVGSAFSPRTALDIVNSDRKLSTDSGNVIASGTKSLIACTEQAKILKQRYVGTTCICKSF